MKCNTCGRDILEGSTFCKYCGSQIHANNHDGFDSVINKFDLVNNNKTIICPSCNKANKPGTKFCTYCGENIQISISEDIGKQVCHFKRHDLPMCLSCGKINAWKIEPILLPHHIITTIILLLFFGAGLFYFIYVLIYRNNPNNRSKICQSCGAENMWSFVY